MVGGGEAIAMKAPNERLLQNKDRKNILLRGEHLQQYNKITQ
jgi:hypothetical protein